MDSVDILLVEDNPGDVNLIERIFDDRDLPGRIHSVQRGDDALDWLHRRGEFSEAPWPDLVLLDLNLPSTSGEKVLEAIKTDERWRRLPVIMLTGSPSEEDVIRMYDAGANAYLLKPPDPEEFGVLIERFVNFWVEAAELPPIDPAAAAD